MDEQDDAVNNIADEALTKALQKSEEDIKAGRVISFSDFKEKLEMNYNIKL